MRTTLFPRMTTWPSLCCRHCLAASPAGIVQDKAEELAVPSEQALDLAVRAELDPDHFPHVLLEIRPVRTSRTRRAGRGEGGVGGGGRERGRGACGAGVSLPAVTTFLRLIYSARSEICARRAKKRFWFSIYKYVFLIPLFSVTIGR